MWQSLHVLSYADAKDELLLEGIRPAIESAREQGLITDAYCLRHWRQGPHVRLNYRAGPGLEATAYLKGALEGYLALDPTPAEYDSVAMLTLHRRLASLEMEEGPLEPLRPDKTVHVASYHPPFHVAGQAAVPLAEQFYSAATPLLLDLIDQTIENANGRRSAILQRMAILALVAGDFQYSTLSYRSHAEAFLNRYDPSGDLRRRFEADLERTGPQLRRLVIDAQRHAEGEGADPDLTAWVDLCHTLFGRLEPVIARGEIRLPDTAYFEELSQRLGTESPHSPSPSQFHRSLPDSPLFQQAMRSPRFAAMRCLLNWHYAAFPLVGLQPVERYRLCYLLSRTAEAMTGTSWSETLATPYQPAVRGQHR